MLVRFSMFVIFLNFLLTNVECSMMSHTVEKEKINQLRKIRQFGDVGVDWIKEILKVNKELLNIQAIIAKDEEAMTNCMTVSKKTNKRHLMCVGSIVNDQHVITSATCIHEATHIRHNLKAPLVVVVGALKSNPQVIRVNSYRVHPEHVVFPYNPLHTKHNIAIIKLSCRIAAEHLTVIKMPTAPYTEVCANDNCMVAIIRRVGKTSLSIYDTRAKQIPMFARKRRSIEVATELQSYNTTEIPLANIQKKLRETLKAPHYLLPTKGVQDILPINITQSEVDFTEIEKLSTPSIEQKIRNFESQKVEDSFNLESNSEDMPFEKLGMLISGRSNSEDVPFEKIGTVISIMQTNSSNSPNKIVSNDMKGTRSLEVISTTTSIADQYIFQGDSDQNYKVRLFSVRESNGFQGCPQTGSPVMFGQIQAALVSIPCDDRQPGTAWKYTDIFINADWIREIINSWPNGNNRRLNSSSSKDVGGCSTCIYNFFIDLTGPNDKVNCTDLDIQDENSPNYKLCASHAKTKVSNNQRSIPMENNLKPSNLRHLDKYNDRRIPRKDSIRQKIKGRITYPTNNEKIPKSSENTLKMSRSKFPIDFEERKNLQNDHIKDYKDIHRLAHKNFGQESSKEFGKDARKGNDRGVGRFHEMDFDKNFDKDFQKKFRTEFQKDINKNLDRDFYRDYDGSIKRKFIKDHYVRNLELQNGNWMKRQIGVDQGEQEILKKNEYNPLGKKFHNLKFVLARIQKSLPEKDVEKLVIGSSVKILPNKEFPNSEPGIRNIKEERVQPIVDRQFAALFRDGEMGGANNHHNVFPGFNGYFL